MSYRILYSLYGTLAGLTIPSGWFLWRAFVSRREWWLKWGHAELTRNAEIYIVLSIFAVLGFALLGYLIGSHKSNLLEETENIHDEKRELEELASTDGLTGLFNARTMRDRLAIEIENAHRSPLTVLLIDLDFFKKINDRFGHPFGDAVLIKAAEIMKRTVRRMDSVGRMGGEEFLIILPDTAAERGLDVAERVREALQKEPFVFDGQSARVTASIGVAVTSESIRDGVTLLKIVDEALYDAKNSGRNRVVLWDSTRRTSE